MAGAVVEQDLVGEALVDQAVAVVVAAVEQLGGPRVDVGAGVIAVAGGDAVAVGVTVGGVEAVVGGAVAVVVLAVDHLGGAGVHGGVGVVAVAVHAGVAVAVGVGLDVGGGEAVLVAVVVDVGEHHHRGGGRVGERVDRGGGEAAGAVAHEGLRPAGVEHQVVVAVAVEVGEDGALRGDRGEGLARLLDHQAVGVAPGAEALAGELHAVVAVDAVGGGLGGHDQQAVRDPARGQVLDGEVGLVGEVLVDDDVVLGGQEEDAQGGDVDLGVGRAVGGVDDHVERPGEHAAAGVEVGIAERVGVAHHAHQADARRARRGEGDADLLDLHGVGRDHRGDLEGADGEVVVAAAVGAGEIGGGDGGQGVAPHPAVAEAVELRARRGRGGVGGRGVGRRVRDQGVEDRGVDRRGVIGAGGGGEEQQGCESSAHGIPRGSWTSTVPRGRRRLYGARTKCGMSAGSSRESSTTPARRPSFQKGAW